MFLLWSLSRIQFCQSTTSPHPPFLAIWTLQVFCKFLSPSSLANSWWFSIFAISLLFLSSDGSGNGTLYCEERTYDSKCLKSHSSFFFPSFLFPFPLSYLLHWLPFPVISYSFPTSLEFTSTLHTLHAFFFFFLFCKQRPLLIFPGAIHLCATPVILHATASHFTSGLHLHSLVFSWASWCLS